MRLILFLISLVSSIQILHAQEGSTVSGQAIKVYLASACSVDSWKTFANTNLAQDLQQRTLKISSTTAISKDLISDQKLNFEMKHDGQNFQFKSGDKLLSSTDPCELIQKFKNPSKSHGWFIRQMLPAAIAKDLISEEKAMDWFLVATYFTGAGICALGTEGVGSFVCTIPFGLALNTLDNLYTKKKFELTINQPFNLFCSKSSVTLEYQNNRIFIEKTEPEFQIKLIDVRTKDVEASNHMSKKAVVARKFLIDLAKKCSDDLAAANLVREFNQQRNEVNRRIATENLSPNPVQKRPSTQSQ